jgi:hypothetical protein
MAKPSKRIANGYGKMFSRESELNSKSRMMPLSETYLQYGVPSDWAVDFERKKIPLTKFRTTSGKILKSEYQLNDDQITFVKNAIDREPIEKDVVQALLEKSNFVCCLCKGEKGHAYIIHHIIEYSRTQDNSCDNLAVLCTNDHDIAHRLGQSLTQKISPDQIRQAKANWEVHVARKNDEQSGKRSRYFGNSRLSAKGVFIAIFVISVIVAGIWLSYQSRTMPSILPEQNGIQPTSSELKDVK